jgi:polar amino acid transport system substrate-binding protein/cystine transport system substrate-binding protein/membrane-bound lytic murein transglycosylase F
MLRFGRLASSFGAIGVVVVLLLAVSLLPPDNSLHDVRSDGSINACVPTSYPPLVTGDPDRPGIDVELLKAVTGRIGVGLGLNTNDAIGRDINPRNWGLNRAQCLIVAGGVVDSTQTRSFLETSPSYARTGWAIVSQKPVGSLKGLNIGILTLVSGLDRIGLATYLQTSDAKYQVVRTPEELTAGIAEHRFDAGITEALLAGRLATDNKWVAAWMPPELARYNLVFGLWKGDLTLKRAIDQAFAELTADGTIARILASYAGTPLSDGNLRESGGVGAQDQRGN